jgi:hypothetical protein
MTDAIRAHERIENKPLPGVSLALNGALSKPVEVYVTDEERARRRLDPLIYFHGAGCAPKHATGVLWSLPGLLLLLALSPRDESRGYCLSPAGLGLQASVVARSALSRMLSRPFLSSGAGISGVTPPAV